MHSNQTNLYSKFIQYVHIRENSNFLITAYANQCNHTSISHLTSIWALSRQIFGSIMFVVGTMFWFGIWWPFKFYAGNLPNKWCAFMHTCESYTCCSNTLPAHFICHPFIFMRFSFLNSITHTLSTKSEVFFVSFTDEADSGDDHSDRGRSHTPEQQNHHQEERPLALNLVSFAYIIFE